MRKIPVTMATQHPDNAREACFFGKRFISASDEIRECYECFAQLGVHEYMWDWEGKFVDEAVIDRLFQHYHDFFKANQLGRDLFLTFRVPNIWEEPSHRLPRAFMNLISAEHAAHRCDFHHLPLFEVILPMTTRADQLIYLQKKFQKIAHATEDIFEMPSRLKHIDVIPLFEEVETMADADQILTQYVDFLEDELHFTPEYMRVFIARSDPALNAGLLPCVLAVKNALSAYHQFGKARGIEIYPWLGGGSLPFRGGINPENVEATLQEYKGLGSITIQSAFRYDYDLPEVKEAIQIFNAEIPKHRKQYRPLSLEESSAIKAFNLKAKRAFQSTIESIAPLINTVAKKVPSHRERVQHIGIFGYSRGVGQVKLPRAIKFTASLYSIGVPPELIGTGRALKIAQQEGLLPLVEELYVHMRSDLQHAGHYLNRENLEQLCQQDKVWKEIQEDIQLIEDILQISIGPEKTHHIIHRNLSSNVLCQIQLNQDIAPDILRAAEIRKSLG